MALDLPRRDFLRGILAFGAPAIVKSANIMPVKKLVEWVDNEFVRIGYAITSRSLADAMYASFYQTKEVCASRVFNLCQIRELLLPGLRELTSRYDQLPQTQWESLFDA